MKTLFKTIFPLAIVVCAVAVLSGCGKQTTNQNQAQQQQQVRQTPDQKNQVTESQLDKNSDGKADFSDPGNDAIGKEVKQMDGLMQSVQLDNYDETDFSDEDLIGEDETTELK